MRHEDVPIGYSGILNKRVLGHGVQFTVKADVAGHDVEAIAGEQGVQLRVQECNFRAIVEFPTHYFKRGLNDPTKWHVGFVQNMLAGSGIMYSYGNKVGDPGTVAMICPSDLPCKDAGGNTTWYDPNFGLSLKQFGVRDELGEFMFPGDFPNPHPARTDIMTRYVEMGDAPGTGKVPLTFRCQQVDPQMRAKWHADYVLGWRDPLDPNKKVDERAPLIEISGVLRFKTWLAMSCDPNVANIKNTTLFHLLYFWEWVVPYKTRVGNKTAQATGQASLLSHGPCEANETPKILGIDANDASCVKFL
jgi:hypothetical protein